MTRDTLEVVLTGTGVPTPVPGRAGPGALIRAGGLKLQFDAGHSTTLRLAEAGVQAEELDAIFLTHHHSDHVMGLADLLMTAWLNDANRVLEVIAPEGLTARYVEESLEALKGDIAVRRAHRRVSTVASSRNTFFSPTAEPQTVWQQGDVRVKAIKVRHEPVKNAVGYLVESGDTRVAISGDTRVCEEMETLAQGVQVLVHEVIAPTRVPPERLHTLTYHSYPVELGAMAARAKVETLMLTHLSPPPDTVEDLRALGEDIRSGGFSGDLIIGCDLASVAIEAGVPRISLPQGRGVGGLFLPNTSKKTPIHQVKNPATTSH